MAQLDIKLFGSSLIQEDILGAAVQELDILFGTEETEFLGDYEFGVNFEQFLWKLQPDIGQVNSYIKRKINDHTYFCNKLNIDVSTSVMTGTIRDIYLVKIELKDSSGKVLKIKDYQLR